MGNEYYGAPTTPTSDYLAHYGVKGMKWGVRKAIASGNTRVLGRQYAKAQRKLAKLERRAASGKKYAKRAAALGAGAAAAGGLAAAGTAGVDRLLKNTGRVARRGMTGLGSGLNAASKFMSARGIPGAGKVGAAGKAVTSAGRTVGSATYGAGTAVGKWGRSDSIVKSAGQKLGSISRPGVVNNTLVKTTGTNLAGYGEKLKKSGVSNNTIARIGAGAVGAGLGIGAGYNAYRAATTKKAAAKAAAAK